MLAFRQKRGFTLVEILIVVAIIAILTAIAVPTIAAHRQTVQERSCRATMRRIIRATEAFLSGNGRYPKSMDELVGEKRFFKIQPTCSYGNTEYDMKIEKDVITITCRSHHEKNHNVNGLDE